MQVQMSNVIRRHINSSFSVISFQVSPALWNKFGKEETGEDDYHFIISFHEKI